MKMLPITLTVFFPTYNEEENITRAITEAIATLNTLVVQEKVSEYEILIVNDGSTDKTKDIVLSLEYQLVSEGKIKADTIRIIDHPTNLGHGRAIQTGLTEGRYDYVFFTDADLQFDINELGLLVDQVNTPVPVGVRGYSLVDGEAATYQIVIGYRVKRKDPLMRLINSRFWNMLSRHLLGLRVKDTNCAFKLFRRDWIKDIPIGGGGAMTTIELLYWLQKNNVPIKEVPVTHHPRAKGQATGAKFSTIWRAIREMYQFYMRNGKI